MQLVLRAVGGLGDTHLRHRHLRHVHEGLDAVMAQGAGALVLPPDQGAYLVALGEQHCGEVATDGADGAGGSGHEDWAVMCRFRRHIAYLVIAFRKVRYAGLQDLDGPLFTGSRTHGLELRLCGALMDVRRGRPIDQDHQNLHGFCPLYRYPVRRRTVPEVRRQKRTNPNYPTDPSTSVQRSGLVWYPDCGPDL